MAIPKVKINGQVIDVTQIVDRELFAVKDVNLRAYPQDNGYPGKLIRTIKPGNRIGLVDSYLVRGSDVWYAIADKMVTLGPGLPPVLHCNYCLHRENLYSLQALKEQGALTEKDKRAEEKKQNTSIFDSISNLFKPDSYLIKYGIPILLIIILISLVRKFVFLKK